MELKGAGMILDIHTHCFPDELADRATGQLTYGGKIPIYGNGTCKALIEKMNIASIDMSVVMPVATKPSQVRTINNWVISIHNKYPRLLSFGSLFPYQDDWSMELSRLKDNGIKGIKLHPDYQKFFVDDERLFSDYEKIADSGLIVLIHAGVDIGLPDPIHCTPPRLARVLDKVPGLRLIAAHMGGYRCWDDVEEYLIGRDIYLDTSYSLADMGSEKMASTISAHGPEKVLFGTDYPWTDTAAEVKGIRSLPLSSEIIDMVLGGNAKKLLDL